MAANQDPAAEHDRHRDDSTTALEVMRDCNRQLLVCAGADIPPVVAEALNQARENLARAIRLLAPLQQGHGKTPAIEQPPAAFNERAQTSAGNFRELLGGKKTD